MDWRRRFRPDVVGDVVNLVEKYVSYDPLWDFAEDFSTFLSEDTAELIYWTVLETVGDFQHFIAKKYVEYRQLLPNTDSSTAIHLVLGEPGLDSVIIEKLIALTYPESEWYSQEVQLLVEIFQQDFYELLTKEFQAIDRQFR